MPNFLALPEGTGRLNDRFRCTHLSPTPTFIRSTGFSHLYATKVPTISQLMGSTTLDNNTGV